jgi:transcription initiation factor IIE alpha subunit
MLSTIDDATLMKVASSLGEEEAVKLIEHLKNLDEITDDEIAINRHSLKFVRKFFINCMTTRLLVSGEPATPKQAGFIFHWKLQPDQLEGFILSKNGACLRSLTFALIRANHDFYYCSSQDAEE